MVSYPAINIVDIVIDEIALEGLDGITLEALWKRLSLRLHDPLPLATAFTEQVWSICMQIDGLDFYKLQIPRAKLTIYDRYEFIDPDLGTILEPDDIPDDIYAHSPVDDVNTGIRGSCATYQNRKNVSEYVKTLNVHQATKEFGESLVLVASQDVREQTLMGTGVCPTLELTVMQYCFLERVGRSRYQGEVTQGRISLSLLKEDPKSLFYHRKFLLDHKLITKQLHHQKTGSHSCSGSLLHLPRFFVERKPKIIYLAEQVIEILKSKENCVAEYDEIRKELQIENSIKKLFKTAFFQKVVKTDLRVPYRTIYPKAEDKEWQQKNNPTKEKTVRVVQLLDPDIDSSELWGKDEINEDDEPFELDISQLKLNVPLLKQANRIVELSGRKGISQCELAKSMGQTKLQARTILRNLVKLKIVATYMNDVGRQRVTKFVSKRFEKSSEMSRQFEQEMDKIKELTKMVAGQPDASQTLDSQTLKEVVISDVKESADTSHDKKQEKAAISCTEVPPFETIIIEELVNTEGNLNCVLNSKTLGIKFATVNKILKKYNITKVSNKYKQTFLNLTERGPISHRVLQKAGSAFPLKKKDQPNIQEVTDNRTRIAEQILEEHSRRTPNLKTVNQAEVITFYDSIEVKLVEQRPQHRLGKPKSTIVGFMEDLHNNEKKNISNITYRLLRRANMIIESVKEHKVIDDLTKLIKMINEEEDREGYDVKIDKKSIIRLLQKLAKDNVVKNIKLTLRANGREKSITFICDPSIGIEHTVIQSAVEQAKIKFCLLGSERMRAIMQKQPRVDEDGAPTVKGNVKGLEASNPAINSKFADINLKYDFKAGKRYGYSPKFIRMRKLHLFLFYSVYHHPGEPSNPQHVQVAKLRENGYDIDPQLEQQMSTIYNTEVGWKMFIPPLTRHAGWPLGWTIMCDVLLRMPLSIFVKVHNVPFFIPDLMNYINHPIKKYFLVKNLPPHIRNTLLIARKYIYNIHESVTRLCYIGLIQFGPQKLKEKDQVFIYLNRKTEITDTTSSAAGYHKIEDKEYPKTSYVFDSFQAVEKYWYDMWNTCINTYLGGRLAVQGKDILLEDLGKKADMIKTLKARAPEEAVTLDNGFVPGDHRGAAGVDSAFFAHLKRNWNWGTDYTRHSFCKGSERKKSDQQRSAHMSQIKANPLRFTEFAGLKKVTGPATQHANELRKKLNQRHKIAEERRSKQQKYQKLVSHHIAKQKSFVRRVLPRQRKIRPRVKYDEVDFCALQQMDKLRVDWHPHEDNILLMCKVAMMYLCPNSRKQLITFTAVRDVLRAYSVHSYNKTSRACQRRLLYMCKIPQTMNSVALGIEEIKQNFYINKRFGGIVEKLKVECQDPYKHEEEVTKIFRELVTYIDKRYYNISDMESRESLVVPKTIQEFNLIYKLKHPTRPANLHGFTKDIKCINGIHSATINSVIHSSMCCGKDRTSWAYQLFRVYQQYPETLLRSAMMKIRTDHMVSIKKSYMCAMKKYGNCMPMSSSQYQLSTGYIYKFQTKWPYEMFNEAHQILCKISQWHADNQSEELNYAVPGNIRGMEAGPVTGGLVMGIHDYLVRGQLDFDIEIPDQIIMLDPRLQEKDETYSRIAQRYQDILTSLDSLNLKKRRVVGSSLLDPEVDEEDELERREFEDKVVKEKREKEDRDRRNYWKSRNDEVGRRLEESEIKLQREKEDVERADKRYKFDSSMMEKKEKYAQVLELGEENVPDAIVSEFRNLEDSKAESDSEQEENYEADEDIDNHTIRFQDGTTITLSREDIEGSSWNSDEEDSQEGNKDSLRFLPLKKKTMVAEHSCQKRCRDSADSEPSQNKRPKVDTIIKDIQGGDISKKASKEDVIQENSQVPNLDDATCNEGKSLMRAWTEKLTDTAEKKTELLSDSTAESNTKQDATVLNTQASSGTSVNDVIKRLRNNFEMEYGSSKLEDMTDMQKRCTRIALLMMREELNDITVSDSHHAHDYFVVNTFKIFCSLKLADVSHPRSLESFHNIRVPMEILPLKTNLAKQLIEDLKHFALFPKDEVSYEEFKDACSMRFVEDELEELEAVHKFVKDKKEIGATNRQIMSKFKAVSKNRLYKFVSMLTEHRLFLRSGVTTARYIHQHFAEPWLIHSYKILRLDKESLVPIPSGSFLSLSERREQNIVKSQLVTDKNLTDVREEPIVFKETEFSKTMHLGAKDASTKSESLEVDKQIFDTQTPEKKDNEPSEHEENCTNSTTGRRMQRKRTALLQSKEIQKAAKKLDFNTAEAIKVVVKPWIRIDGVLNRKVLDRMLGAVLSYCIVHPGIMLPKIQRRFMPALQPFHTTELVEMLVKLECLVMRVLHMPKVTLFSQPAKTRLRPTTGLDSDDELVLEPAIDASIKFGMFLGNRTYSLEFLP